MQNGRDETVAAHADIRGVEDNILYFDAVELDLFRRPQ